MEGKYGQVGQATDRRWNTTDGGLQNDGNESSRPVGGIEMP
jgi:hypothetical protein